MNTLRCQPVRRDRHPRYPTRLQVLATPDLLKRHQPAAWLTNRDIAAATGVFLAANLSGCAKSPSPPSATRKGTLAPDAPAIVAPIFEHGDGRGVWGGLGPMSVFLREEDALQVIRDELTRAGLDVTEDKTPLPHVSIPTRMELPAYEWVADRVGMHVEELPLPGTPPLMHLKDPHRSIAVRYVSERGYGDVGGPLDCSTRSLYDFQETARFFAKHLRKQARGLYLGVFYDPVADASGQGWRAGHDRSVEQSKRLLRQQVKDFVDWLKAQGAI